MQEWPQIEESLLKEDSFEVPVQINGKVRGKITVLASDGDPEARERVLSEKAFSRYLDGVEIKKLIYVKGRVVNVVI